ncbi:MAG: hypothetical protein M0Z67_14115 [Nitrospiraceae bacterium]|nr:hypothetical protein [Nitrospiraceae bacterium]
MDSSPANDYSPECSQNHQGLGNDCSGFVSMSWKLRTRYDTSLFTLIGGFDCDYSNNPSNTPINGSLTISNGTVTIGKILLK